MSVQMIGQMMRFGVVGALATGIHMLLGLMLIGTGWAPLYANIGAFVAAFGISLIGHLGFTFADQDPDLRHVAWRFALVALAGFAVNEAVLSALLDHTALSGRVALCLSTACASTLTFALSRGWAFHPHRRAPHILPSPSSERRL